MVRRPPRSTRPATLVPVSSLFRSADPSRHGGGDHRRWWRGTGGVALRIKRTGNTSRAPPPCFGGPPPPKGEDRQRPLPTPKDRSKCPSSKNPGDDSLRQRGAQVARFGKAVRRDAFRGEDGFGGLRGGVDDHPIGDAPDRQSVG